MAVRRKRWAPLVWWRCRRDAALAEDELAPRLVDRSTRPWCLSEKPALQRASRLPAHYDRMACRTESMTAMATDDGYTGRP